MSNCRRTGGRTAGAARFLFAFLVCLVVVSCGGGAPAPEGGPAPAQRSAVVRRPLPDLRHMRAMHLGGNWGGNSAGFQPPLLADAPALSASSVSIQSSVGSFQDSAGVTHTNDVATVQLNNVQLGGKTLARAGFWVYRDVATGAAGLQLRPQLDPNLSDVTGFAGDINVSLDSNGNASVDGVSGATGDALALAKAVLAHGPELVTRAESVTLGAGSTIGQPATLSSILLGMRTALSSGDAQFFAQLKSMNVEWIGLSVAMHYDSYSDPTVRTHVCASQFPDSGGTITACTFPDETLESIIARARAAGFHVYLTLAFEHPQPDSQLGATCGTPQFKENRTILGAPTVPDWANASKCIAAADWWWNPAHPDYATKVQAFFDSYRQVAVKYAALAESTGVELFSLGTETENLFRTRPSGGSYTNHFLPQLQAMVAGVRAVYGGAVTYDQSSELYFRPGTYGGNTAGGADLFNDIDLDVVGSSAYFPLADTAPGRVLTVAEHEASWEKIFQAYLLPMRAKYGNKPIVFTEVGYTDDVDSPWATASNEGSPAPAIAASTPTAGMQQQSNIYQAFFNVNALHGDLVGGTFWWGYEYFPARADLCSYVAFSVYCNASATGVVANAYQGWRRKDADRVFTWAASVYPTLFGGNTATGVYAGYYYRYHAASGIYLGLQETTGEIYVHDGNRFNFLDAGTLRDYLNLAAAAGY
jgi:hypothetical protein